MWPRLKVVQTTVILKRRNFFSSESNLERIRLVFAVPSVDDGPYDLLPAIGCVVEVMGSIFAVRWYLVNMSRILYSSLPLPDVSTRRAAEVWVCRVIVL